MVWAAKVSQMGMVMNGPTVSVQKKRQSKEKTHVHQPSSFSLLFALSL
jgi:hypothetical protein